MSNNIWIEVDHYFNAHLLGEDPVLESALAANTHAELPAIDVTPSLGKLLYLLARTQQAKRILEIGTLGGYSTIWLARALPPEGKVVTLELEKKHAEIAQSNIERAGLAEKVEIVLGKAADSLEALIKANSDLFDFIFIDADKESLPIYFTKALKLSKPGSVIVIDNVVRNGAVIDAKSEDMRVQGVRRMVSLLAEQTGIEATFVQTVGSKGYDGFIVAYVTGAATG